MSLIYEDRTRLLKKMFYEVQNEVGLGRHEVAYHRACVEWLRSAGIPFASKPPHRLMLGDLEAHVLYPDLVLWNEITVELKALPRMTTSGDVVQLFDYLKCRNDRVGFLVNMGLDRVVDQRFIYDPPQYELVEDWTYWVEAIDGVAREVGAAVRDGLRLLYREHRTGYGHEVVERLVPAAIAQQGLKVVKKPVCQAYFRGQVVDESSLDCLVVEDQIVVAFTALFEDPQFGINRGLSYMRALGIEWGIAVEFGRATARFTGTRQRLRCKS